MNNLKCKLSGCFCAAAILAAGAPALAGEAGTNDLPASVILESIQARYQALASYSDEGRMVTIRGGTITTNVFSIRLARTNFYRLEWTRIGEAYFTPEDSGVQAVWSSGSGDFSDTGCGRVEELSRAAAFDATGGVALMIPGIFFNTQPGEMDDQLRTLKVDGLRQADENVAGVSCYVFVKQGEGWTKTFWVGTQDLLVRQVRLAVNAEVMQKSMAQESSDLELINRLHDAGMLASVSTETHFNIVLNKPYARTDFVPSFPSYHHSY